MVGVPKRLLAEAGVGAEDTVYARLVEMHEGLSPAASEVLNARLVLILATMLNDETSLREAIAQAMEGLDPDLPRVDRGG